MTRAAFSGSPDTRDCSTGYITIHNVVDGGVHGFESPLGWVGQLGPVSDSTGYITIHNVVDGGE
jgi:hypothetical protein